MSLLYVHMNPPFTIKKTSRDRLDTTINSQKMSRLN